MGFNWKCPFCQHAQVVNNNHFRDDKSIWVADIAGGPYGYTVDGIVCANADCKELTMVMGLFTRKPKTDELLHRVKHWYLLPESTAKPQPDFIPAPLRQDYAEAARIVALSPKASATLARRCLQGMIRDFCNITKPTLKAEIEALRKAVDEGDAPRGVLSDTVDAIDHVRSIGNIGAHMEKDIDLIIEIDAGEAEKLIGLIELLFEEWYVERESRKAKLAKIGLIAAEKDQAKLNLPAKQIEGPK